jgi:hypothetical protein
VLKAWRAVCSFNVGSSWALTGKLKDRPETFAFQIEDKGVRFTLPINGGFWDADLMLQPREFMVDPTSHYQSPRGRGGLFTALYLLRRVTVSETLDDAEVVYTGTAPIVGNLDKLYDVFTVLWRGNEVRFYTDPQTGAMALIEMYGSSLDFPCEVYFYDKTMEVRFGRLLYGIFETETLFKTADGRRQTAAEGETEEERLRFSRAARVDSGDLIEVELVIESKNDYESLIIEDFKAAGLEPVDIRSGYNGNELGAYVEFRDEKVSFFVYRLMRGKHTVSYRLRAEIPGEFSALPTVIQAMYAPELKGNSDENKVKVVDR